MPFLELRYFSKALGINTAANVIVPDQSVPGPYQVMFLLHGLSDDHTIWARRTSIERYVDGLPLIVVMPTTGRGFYLDAEQGPAYGTAIGVELPALVEHLFPTKTGWCTTGLSMGGYGAIKLALSHPDLFVSAASHSGALEFGHLSGHYDGSPLSGEWIRILGENPVGGPNDLFAISSALEVEKRPKLRIDCGVDDFLIDSNRNFVRQLTQIGYAHEYQEFPGGHTWEYWDLHVQEAIAFHRQNLGL